MTATPAASDSKVLMISSDCHAGALPSIYEQFMEPQYHEHARVWWVQFAREMMQRAGTFFDQEAVEAYEGKSGEASRMSAPEAKETEGELSDSAFLDLLSDEHSAFAPRRGEFNIDARIVDLDGDGVAGEVIFPQMAPFGAGLSQYRKEVPKEHNLAGIRAYNRWLASFCSASPERHAGVALINVDDVDVAVAEIREAKSMGLWGGVLLPTSTGDNPYYHDPCYEPLWAVCEELDMPLHSHSGWSPDYGDADCATAMFISEVDKYAQRAFAPLVWSGAFERHPGLKFVFTETGTQWILETLRVLEFKAADPIFKYFTKDLTLSPSEYFARQCYLGASFMRRDEGEFRNQIGLDRILYGTDYPHLEGTWPNTHEKLSTTFAGYSESDARAILGGNALDVYAFDREKLAPIVDRIGPRLSDICGEA
jgi:predicted TIM-barrel fold metal-dependent hydrolase